VGADFATAPINRQLIVIQIIRLSRVTGNMGALAINPAHTKLDLNESAHTLISQIHYQVEA